MQSKFWEAVGDTLANRWAAVAVPALAFWLGGLLAWVWHEGGPSALEPATRWLTGQPVAMQAAAGLALLFAVAGTGLAVQRTTTPVLRVLEGYWPRALDPLRRWSANRSRRHAEALDERFQVLAAAVTRGTASPGERAEYVRVDQQLRRLPADRDDCRPTRIGNTLRAAESHPRDKYGLDAVTVWPHLWLLLPEATQRELAAARGKVDAAVQSCVWGALFIIFAGWAWWTAPIGVLVVAVAYKFWLTSRAEVFADLLEATFDLHRRALYEQIRWPLPRNPSEENDIGKDVTQYLARGSDKDTPTFSTDHDPSS